MSHVKVPSLNPTLPMFQVKIAPKDAPARYQIVEVAAHNRSEAHTIAEGMYPAFKVIW